MYSLVHIRIHLIKNVFYMKRRYTLFLLGLLTLSIVFSVEANHLSDKKYDVPLIGNAFEVGYISGASTIDKNYATISTSTKNNCRKI